MKYNLFFIAIAMIIFGIISCDTDCCENNRSLSTTSTSTTSTSIPWNGIEDESGDIVINGVRLLKTSMVQVLSKPTIIEGTNGYNTVFFKDRRIKLTPYKIGKYEVTQQLYETVMDASIDYNRGKGDTFPVYYVNWYNAVLFCNKLTTLIKGADNCVYYKDEAKTQIYDGSTDIVYSDFTKTGYRLPTEEEWECAARGGDQSQPEWRYIFSGVDIESGATLSGDHTTDVNLDTVAWYNNNAERTNHEVGTKKPNRLGIYDMSGNVSEWCYNYLFVKADKLKIDEACKGEDGIPVNPKKDTKSVNEGLRGGSIGYGLTNCDVGYRGLNCGTTGTTFVIGFRIVCSGTD